MDEHAIKELKEMAKIIRRDIVEMIGEAKSGHPGGSLSAADIVTYLYFSEMNIDPLEPKWKETHPGPAGRKAYTRRSRRSQKAACPWRFRPFSYFCDFIILAVPRPVKARRASLRRHIFCEKSLERNLLPLRLVL